MDRRDFLKTAGAGALAAGAAVACKNIDTKAPAGAAAPAVDGEMARHPLMPEPIGLLGYGCMRWQMKRDENGRNVVDQDSVNELVDYAIAHGVNYFDSSPVYLQGQSESATGIALRRHPRESYFIATKMSNMSIPTYEASVAQYRQSFENYQTDYIDYYLMHIISSEQDFRRRFLDNGVVDFLVKEREAGRIRHLGFSFHGSPEAFDYMMSLHERYHWDFVQIQMNYYDWNHASGRNSNASYLYEQLDKREIPVVIMEPLQGGRLSSVAEGVAAQMKEREPERSIASWAFRFVGSFPRVLCALSGMTYMEHLVDNVGTFTDFQPLTEEEMDFLERMVGIMANYPLVPCNDCSYCMPCPYGIDIPTIFRHYNAAVNGGEVVENTEARDYKRLKKRYLTTYDKAVETLRQADHCIGCGQCEPHCPQNIRIPQQLHRIDRYVESLKQDKF